MSSGGAPGSDCDLLLRLNALKKSTIDLDHTKPTFPPAPQGSSIDPLPARALHADLLDRFKILTGSTTGRLDTSAHDPETDAGVADINEDDKTVEELLADLGSAEQWDVHKSEHDEVEDLLRAADVALKTAPDLEQVPGQEEADDEATKAAPVRLPAVDVSVFQPEPESDEEDGQKQSKQQLRDGVNTEADDVLRRLMDEVRYEQKHGGNQTQNDGSSEAGSDSESDEQNDTGPTFDLPAAPSKDLETTVDDPTVSKGDEDLAARFASLSLPSVPTTLKPNNNSAPTAKPPNKFLDEEIDTWCIICSDDATLSCLGCDGDLYCMNCWMEGHRGEDAGFEERRHRAVEYVKGGGKKKVKGKRTRVMVGA